MWNLLDVRSFWCPIFSMSCLNSKEVWMMKLWNRCPEAFLDPFCWLNSNEVLKTKLWELRSHLWSCPIRNYRKSNNEKNIDRNSKVKKYGLFNEQYRLYKLFDHDFCRVLKLAAIFSNQFCTEKSAGNFKTLQMKVKIWLRMFFEF